MARWREYFEAHVTQEIATERAFMVAGVGGAIGETAAELHEHFEKMIEAKRQGQEIATAEHPKLAPVIDLMEALKKSIAEKTPTTAGGKKPPVRAVSAQAQAAAPEKKRKKSSAG